MTRRAAAPDALDESSRQLRTGVASGCYARIIDGCRAAARELGCKLIEVEPLWAGTEFEEATV